MKPGETNQYKDSSEKYHFNIEKCEEKRVLVIASLISSYSALILGLINANQVELNSIL